MSKRLVAYYSASGVTAKVAEKLAMLSVQTFLRFSRKFRTPRPI